MSSSFEQKYQDLLKIYEDSEGDIPAGNSVISDLTGIAAGAIRNRFMYYTRFRKFCINAKKEIREITREHNILFDNHNKIKPGITQQQRAKHQARINSLSEDLTKWDGYLKNINTKKAKQDKALLQIIRVDLNYAETGSLRKSSRTSTIPRP